MYPRARAFRCRTFAASTCFMCAAKPTARTNRSKPAPAPDPRTLSAGVHINTVYTVTLPATTEPKVVFFVNDLCVTVKQMTDGHGGKSAVSVTKSPGGKGGPLPHGHYSWRIIDHPQPEDDDDDEYVQREKRVYNFHMTAPKSLLITLKYHDTCKWTPADHDEDDESDDGHGDAAPTPKASKKRKVASHRKKDDHDGPAMTTGAMSPFLARAAATVPPPPLGPAFANTKPYVVPAGWGKSAAK